MNSFHLTIMLPSLSIFDHYLYVLMKFHFKNNVVVNVVNNKCSKKCVTHNFPVVERLV